MKKILFILLMFTIGCLANDYHIKLDLVSYAKHSEKLKHLNLVEGTDNNGKGFTIYKRYNKIYSYGVGYYHLKENSWGNETKFVTTSHEFEYEINGNLSVNATGYIGYQKGYCGGMQMLGCDKDEKNHGIAVGGTVGVRLFEYFYIDGMGSPNGLVTKAGLHYAF